MRIQLAGALLLATIAGRLSAQEAPAAPVPLYDNLGTHHVEISSRVPQTQRYFDQGMRLVYGFNHGEAIRAFEAASRADPACAICHWGAALAYGPHVNAPMDSASGVQAYAHLRKAQALAPKASARERALIQALAARYTAVPPANRGRLDSAYARAMATVAARYPDDLDIATLHAESLMDLRPWAYWTKDGKPQPGTDVIVSRLERTLSRNPNHPGACHYYIHAVEAVAPEKAVPCAERLASLMPGAGHVVHMPAHIYIRVGRYADAIDANVHAVHADETYIAAEKPTGIYPIGYYPHNYHFLAFAATLAGRSAQAIEAARALSAKVPVEVARQVPSLESLIPFHDLTLVTFGRWDELLAVPLPPADLRVSTGLAHYARGVAHAARGHLDVARAMLDTVRRIAEGTTPHDQTAMSAGAGENKTVMQIAMHALMGEIALRESKAEEAVAHFREAAKLEDSFNYIEPPQWYYPVRHSLGAALLAAGKPVEAEAAYREDLKRFPENGWALHGLKQALAARGASTAEVDARLQKAWAGADVQLTASRF